MARNDKTYVLFGNDEIDKAFDGKFTKKASGINFFNNLPDLLEIEKIRINDKISEALLEKINELLESKPSIVVDIHIKDAKDFPFDKISSTVNLLISFESLDSTVDLCNFKKLKRLNISSLDGSCKKFLNAIESLEQLEDLRLGHFRSNLEFINGLSHLRRLDLKNIRSSKGLYFLNNKQSLKYFIIYKGQFSDYKRN